MDIAKGEQLLERLRAYVKEQGGELPHGWRVDVKRRSSGTSAGTSDAYYFDPNGQRFRSRQEIVRHLQVSGSKADPVSRTDAATNAQAAVGTQQTPLVLDNGVTITRLGNIDTRSAYHSQTQLWPVGYQATWQDASAGTFHCSISDGGDAGPRFKIALAPGQSQTVTQSLVEAQDIDTAWEELASIQQAGLDAALAAKSKPRKPKQAQASTDPANIPSIANGHPASAPNGADTASSAAAETVSAATTANAQPTAPAAAVPPAPEQASQRDQQQGHQQSAALTNGHSAPSASGIGPGTGGVQLQDSQENMAANSQQSEHASQKPAESQARAEDMPYAPAAPVSDQAHQSKEASSEPEEPDAATIAKQHLLVKAAPLAGMWAAERFGLADVKVLKLLEALPGVEEHCSDYEYVEQRHGWDAEQKRLQKQLDRHGKQAAKASKGLEKKGAKLHQIQLQEQAKLDKAEERMEARAAAKRKREEEKQAEKAELKRAKLEQADAAKAQKQKPKASPGGTLKTSPQNGAKGSASQGKASASGSKAKARSTSGMTKDEKDIQHVLNKAISKVERDFNREQEKAAQKAEKDAAKAQRRQ